MELCSGKGMFGKEHEEICFEGGNCPLCLLQEESDTTIEKLQKTIERLDKEGE